MGRRQSKTKALRISDGNFTLPDYFTDADVQKVKDAALKKMAIAFNTHKKIVWANYLAAEMKTPEFKGTLEKQNEPGPLS